MKNIHKLINVVMLMSTASGEVHGTWDTGSHGEGKLKSPVEVRSFNLPKELQKKFQIGSTSLCSDGVRFLPVTVIGDENQPPDRLYFYNELEALFLRFCGNMPEELSEKLRSMYLESKDPLPQDILTNLAICYQKNIIGLEIGEGVWFKSNFFKKMKVIRLVEGNIEVEETKSDWLEDQEVINQFDDESFIKLALDGAKTVILVYHMGLKKIFFLILCRANELLFPMAEGESSLEERVKKMDEARENRLDRRIAAELCERAAQTFEGVPLRHQVAFPTVDQIMNDDQRRMIEEVQICNGERKARGLPTLQELMNANNGEGDREGIIEYFKELAQRFGRETTDPLRDSEDVKRVIRYEELMYFENSRRSQGRPGLYELVCSKNLNEIKVYCRELANLFGRETLNPLDDFAYIIHRIVHIPEFPDLVDERSSDRAALQTYLGKYFDPLNKKYFGPYVPPVDEESSDEETLFSKALNFVPTIAFVYWTLEAYYLRTISQEKQGEFFPL
jgi:hypothetical protein